MSMHNPPHPGEFILATYMEPYGLSCRYLAEQLDEAVARIVEYIEFYNRDRLRSGIGYQSPHQAMLACA